jgi:hypothetical protein
VGGVSHSCEPESAPLSYPQQDKPRAKAQLKATAPVVLSASDTQGDPAKAGKTLKQIEDEALAESRPVLIDPHHAEPNARPASGRAPGTTLTADAKRVVAMGRTAKAPVPRASMPATASAHAHASPPADDGEERHSTQGEDRPSTAEWSDGEAPL